MSPHEEMPVVQFLGIILALFFSLIALIIAAANYWGGCA